MTKSELENYARENRKRLEAQEVKLGDVVEVLIGQFAGEKGVVVGIIACGNDYADPYYEIDMDCEVPDKYKCRKNSLMPNVVGGFNAYEFVVCGNRAPEQPTDEIKVGDIVRVKDDAPKDVWQGGNSKSYSTRYKFIPFEVEQIEEDGLETYAYTISTDGFLHCRIPTRYLEPYYSAEDVRRMEEDLQREKEQHLREHSGKENDDPIKDIADMMEEYRKGFAKITSELVDFDWQQYRAELASKIAVAYAERAELFEPRGIGELAVTVANDVVDNLKKHEV